MLNEEQLAAGRKEVRRVASLPHFIQHSEFSISSSLPTAYCLLPTVLI